MSEVVLIVELTTVYARYRLEAAMRLKLTHELYVTQSKA